MYHRVIVPIEEGAGAESLDPVRPLVRDLGCELTILHVHHVQEAPPELEGLTQYRFQHVVEAWDGRDHDAEERECAWVAAVAAEIAGAEPGLAVSSRVVHAPLAGTLAERDERVLVVAPQDGVGGLGDGQRLGPTAQELIRGGGVPILLVRAGRPLTPIRRILVTLDGSRFSMEVLDPALELARACGARLSLLEVVTRHSGLIRLLHPGDRSAESAERFLRRVRDRVARELGPVDVRVVEDEDAARAIAAEVERDDFDLVAMATHGRGGLRRLLLGSVAERVMREVDVPVLLYRPSAVSVAPEPEVGSGAAHA